MLHVWIDTDPGIDDSVALGAAFKHRDSLDILGISTVAGNQTIEKVTTNALYLTRLFGADDIPVYKGANAPLARASHSAGHIHGEFGLGPIKPEMFTDNFSSLNAVDGMKKAFFALPDGEKATILPIGPLTNIALLLKTYPEVKDKIEKIVFMGGSLSCGNVTSLAEFNVWHDPEAAHIVLKSGLKLVMCGLDLTMKCTLPEEYIGRIRSEYLLRMEKNEEHKTLQTLFDMLKFYLESPAYRDKREVAMHDVCTVLYLLYPELFHGEMHAVDVYLSDDICRGLTYRLDTPYSDYGDKYEPNVLVLNGAENTRFRDVVMETLLRY